MLITKAGDRLVRRGRACQRAARHVTPTRANSGDLGTPSEGMLRICLLTVCAVGADALSSSLALAPEPRSHCHAAVAMSKTEQQLHSIARRAYFDGRVEDAHACYEKCCCDCEHCSGHSYLRCAQCLGYLIIRM